MTSTITCRSTWGAHIDKSTNFCTCYDYYRHNKIISQINYQCDNHMLTYSFTTFQRQLFQCMVYTMIWIKYNIEEFRCSGSAIIIDNDDNRNVSTPLGDL